MFWQFCVQFLGYIILFLRFTMFLIISVINIIIVAHIKTKTIIPNVLLLAGAEKAGYVAEKTLRKVYKKVGFVAR